MFLISNLHRVIRQRATRLGRAHFLWCDIVTFVLMQEQSARPGQRFFLRHWGGIYSGRFDIRDFYVGNLGSFLVGEFTPGGFANFDVGFDVGDHADEDLWF